MAGKCVKCGKDVRLEKGSVCKCCLKQVCWACWIAEGHECPECHTSDSKRDYPKGESK